jgi:signal peptidase
VGRVIGSRPGDHLRVVAYGAIVLLPGASDYVVASNSMAPAIDSGSLVYVQDTGEYDPGDVITFTEGERIVTHRVVAASDSGYVTKGDANDGRDAWRVRESQIHGEVVVAVPLYGRLVSFVGTPVGYVTVVVVPVVALIALELRHLRAAFRS